MALTGDITGSLLASMSASGGVNGEIAFDGSGTDNYNELDNKPSINGVVLEGNKTSADLHISSEGTDNYNDLLNKPKINGTTLTGDVSDTQLQIDYNHLINKPDIPDISDIETRLDTAETDIDNLQSDMSTAEDNIDDMLDDIASIKATDLTQNADISSLKSRVSSAESTITTHATEISALDGRVTTAEGDIDTLQGDMTQAQSDISELNSSLVGNTLFSGNSNSSISLSDDVSNYSIIEIFYRSNDGYHSSVKILATASQFMTNGFYLPPTSSSATTVYFKNTVWNISGFTISPYASNQISIPNGSSPTTNKSANFIYITKVVGYPINS